MLQGYPVFDLLSAHVALFPSHDRGSQTCSKMRLDEFAGGAVAVYRGATHFVVPDSIAYE